MQKELSKTVQIQNEADELILRLDDVCAQLNETQVELEEKEQGNSELQEKLSASEAEMDLIHERLNEFDGDEGSEVVLKSAVDRLKNAFDKHASLEEELRCKDQETIELKSEVDDLNAKLAGAFETVRQRYDEVIRLESDLDDLRDAVSVLKDETSSKDEDIVNLRDTIDNLNGEFAVKSLKDTGEIERLEAALGVSEEQVASLGKDASAKDEMINKLQSALDDAILEAEAYGERDNAVEKLAEDLKGSRATVSSLEEELHAKTASFGDVKAESDAEIAIAKSTLDEVKSRIVALEEQMLSKDEELDECNSALDGLKCELERYHTSEGAEVTKVQESLRESESKLEAVEEQLCSKDTEIEKLRNAVNNELNDATARTNSARDVEVAVLRSALKEAEVRAAAVEEELLNRDSEIDELDEAHYEAQGKVAAAEEELRVKDEELVSLRSTVDDLVDELNSKVEDQATREEGIAMLRKDLAEVASRTSDMESQLQSKNDEIQGLRDTIKYLEVQLGETSLQPSAASFSALEAANDQLKSDLNEQIARKQEWDAALAIKHTEIDDHLKRIDELRISLEDRETSKTASECDLNSKIEDCQARIDLLTLEVQNKESELGNLRRELKLSQLENLKSNELDGDVVNSETVESPAGEDYDSESDLAESPESEQSDELKEEIAQTESDAKEAVRELVTELNVAVTEKNAAIEDLAEMQNVLQTMKELCNQRELETIALETSLRKALAMTEDSKDGVINDEVRQVIGELVEEIARMRSNVDESAPKCESCEEAKAKMAQLTKDLNIADDTTDLEADRADVAEKSLRDAQDALHGKDSEINEVWTILLDLIHQMSTHDPCSAEVDDIGYDAASLSTLAQNLKRLLELGGEETDIGRNSPVSSVLRKESDATDTSTGADTPQSNKSFADALNQMIDQSTDAIQNALTDFNCDLSEDGDEMVGTMISKVPTVEFHVYESLRRKYDALQDEREDLLNETFALLDTSAAANAAEIEAVTLRVEKEAAWRVAECRIEAEERMEYLEERLASCVCRS